MEAQQCYTVHGGRGATLASIMLSVSGLCRKQQHIQWKLKSGSTSIFNGNSRAEATTYLTETQERKQYTTFKEARQRIQEQKKARKRTLKTGRKHEADTQERWTIILEFTEKVSQCSEQVSLAFKSDKFEVHIISYNTALNNPKPLSCIISNDYLTSNCYKHVTIFTGPEFG
jgi:hypothetical protein